MKTVVQFRGSLTVCALILLAGGCAFLQPPHSDYRPIHQAAAACDAETVSKIIQTDPKTVNLEGDGGRGPLHVATARCCTNVLEVLLHAGAKLEIKGETGERALHVAAQEGCVEGVKLLVRKGARINARDAEGHTPLRRAIDYNQSEIVPLLRSLGGTE